MDVTKLKTADWLMVGGGAAMLVLGIVLPWTTVSGDINESGDTPFDYFFTGGLAWLLVVGVGVLALLRTQDRLRADAPWDAIFVAMAGIATLLMLLRVLIGPYDTPLDNVFDIELGRGIGMIGALAWSAITFSGAVKSLQEAGGSLSALTDPNRLRGRSGSDAPPPPRS